MNGPGAGAWATGVPVGPASEPHDPFSTRPTPAPPARPTSDYIIKEKTVLLQKKDSEGFGFVLRGAKGECRPAGEGLGDGQGEGDPAHPQPPPQPQGAGPSATAKPPP